jgi:hypothetical protein
MGELTDELLGQSAAEGAAVGRGIRGILEQFTGAARGTPETGAGFTAGTIPELSTSLTAEQAGGQANVAQLGAGFLATLDPGDRVEIIQSVLPEATFREDEQGNVFTTVGDQEFVVNRPGFSQSDILPLVAQLLTFGRASQVQGFLARSLAGAGTSIGLDVAAEAAGADVDPIEAAARAAVAGAATGIVPPAAGARRAIPGALEDQPAVLQAGQQAARETGIDLFPAQQTRVPAQLDRQAFVAELPGGSQTALRALERQNEQAFNAATDFLDGIAPPTALETGPARFRTAAQQSVERAKVIRSEKASPLFKQAFDEGLNIDLVQELPKFPQSVSAGPFTARVSPPIGRPGESVFRETGPGGLRDLVLADRDGSAVARFFANEREFALGQGSGKGILVKARPDFIAGERSFAKPGLKIPGSPVQEFESQFLAAGFIDEIVVSPGVKLGALERRVMSQVGLSERTLPDGTRVFSKPTRTVRRTLLEEIAIPLDQFPKGGEIHRSLTKVQNLIKNAGTDLRRLHNVKTEIDQLINKTGEGGLGPTTKRELLGVQDQLVGQLEAQSSLYAQARTAFREASPAVDELRDSILGRVARIDDVQLKNISRRIFDPAETNPAVVRSARKAIQTVDPDAWTQLLRVELERRLGSIKPPRAGAVQNVPGQLADAIFGNTKQSRVIFDALPPEMVSNARFLEAALRRAGLGRPGGSQTAARQEFAKELGGPAGVIRRWLFRPFESAADAGQNAAFQRRAASFARAAFDPSFTKELARIQKLKGQAQRNSIAALLGSALAIETREGAPVTRGIIEEVQNGG